MKYFVSSQSRRILGHIVANRGHVAVIGPPGAGKSTLLRYVLTELVSRKRLALLIPLRNLATAESLVSLIVERLGEVLPRSVVARKEFHTLRSDVRRLDKSDEVSILKTLAEILSRQPSKTTELYLLLDGLDEAADGPRLAALLEHAVASGNSPFRIVVTARALSTVERLVRLHDWTRFHLEGLTESEAREYLAQEVGEATANEIGDEILKLANGNPLRLLVLSDLFRRGLTVGEDRNIGAASLLDGLTEHLVDDLKIGGESVVDSTRLLKLLTAFHPCSTSRLSELSGNDPARIRKLFRRLSITLVSESDEISFVHESIHEAMLRKYFLPREIDHSELRFGDEAAERDSLLGENYIARTNDLSALLSGERTIVLGDRGAGKSALFTRLREHEERESDDNAVVVEVSRDIANVLQAMNVRETSGSSADEFKALWLAYLAAIVGRGLVRKGIVPDRTRSRLRRMTHTVLHSFGWGDLAKETVLERSLRHARDIFLGGVTLSVGPLTIDPKEVARAGRRNKFEVTAFLEQANLELEKRGVRLTVAFDQIDEAYKYNREVQESMVQGLFLAEAYVSQMSSIRLCAFLRTDLFEVFDIQEKNKFISRIVRLEWPRRELIRMILSRICSNPELSGIGELLENEGLDERVATEGALRIIFPETLEGNPFEQWLFKLLANGNQRVSPRQIVIFLNIARGIESSMVRNSDRLTLFRPQSILDSMTRLSVLSYEEFVSDFRVAREFVQSCRAAKISDFELEEVEELFSEDEGTVAEQVECLERLGFLERRIVDRGGTLEARFVIPALFTRGWERGTQSF